MFFTRLSPWRLPFKADSKGNVPCTVSPWSEFEEFTSPVILQHEKFLQFDWLWAVVFQLNRNTFMRKLAYGSLAGSSLLYTTNYTFHNGLCALWGKVWEAQPPYLVMLITVEPLESQLRHDRRFLNLWIKDISCITPSPSAGRLVPMCITQLVYWPLVA